MAEESTEEQQETEQTEQTIPYERFQQANTKAKEAAQRAATLEKQVLDLTAKFEERDAAGLPELERERKAREALEKRLADADKRAEVAEQQAQRTQKERWVEAAAAELNFQKPGRAARLIDDLDAIESAVDAERAVKRLAKSDGYLVKQPEPRLPGRVLENGQPPPGDPRREQGSEEGTMILEGIRALQQNWQPAGDL